MKAVPGIPLIRIITLLISPSLLCTKGARASPRTPSQTGEPCTPNTSDHRIGGKHTPLRRYPHIVNIGGRRIGRTRGFCRLRYPGYCRSKCVALGYTICLFGVARGSAFGSGLPKIATSETAIPSTHSVTAHVHTARLPSQ